MDTELKHVSRELLIEIDANKIIIDISSNCYNILGYEQNEIIGSNLNNYTDDDIGRIDINNSNNFELTLKNKDGEIAGFYDALIYPNNSSGADISLIDISKYKKIEEENMFEDILRNSKDIIYRYEILPERKFTYINHAVEEQLGVTEDKNYNEPITPFHLTHPEDYEIQVKKINGTLDYSKPTEIRLRNKDGKYIWFEDFVTPYYNEKKELVATYGFCRNIQDRKELEERLEELSFYDSLTTLFSSNYYHKQEKKLNEVDDRSIGVIICDLDNLKKINDSLGHTYGDRLLINFGNLLRGEIDKDTVARFGGDEFVILVENTSEENVKNTYFRLQKSIEKFNESNATMPIEVSIGWSYSTTSLGVMEEVFNTADNMMYKNKLSKKIRCDF